MINQSAQLPPFGDEDIPHIGQLFRKIRESRGVTNIKKFAEAISACEGVAVSHATISRFEGSDPTTRVKTTKLFPLLVQALQYERLGDITISAPLKNDEAKLLTDLYNLNRTKRGVIELQKQLDQLRFDLIDPQSMGVSRGSNRSVAYRTLREVVEALEGEGRPAFVADELWFIHAMNGAAFELFNIDPESKKGASYLQRWEAWNVLASKFTSDSPVRKGHTEVNRYFPPTVHYFFREAHPYLFTVQMRSLLSKLQEMSKTNRLDFDRMWESCVTFMSFLQPEDLNRSLLYRGQKINATATERHQWTVYPERKYPVVYWIGIWNPEKDDETSQQAFERIKAMPNSRKIYYAADWDKDTTFHVNQWPEVRQYLDALYE